MSVDNQEIILRLSGTARNAIASNFGTHIQALNVFLSGNLLEQDVKRQILADNKRLIQDLIDLPIIDNQRRSTDEFRLEFSLRNRLLTNVAKNNLFLNNPENALFGRQFKQDLIDENSLLIAFLNSLEPATNGALGEQGIYFY